MYCWLRQEAVGGCRGSSAIRPPHNFKGRKHKESTKHSHPFTVFDYCQLVQPSSWSWLKNIFHIPYCPWRGGVLKLQTFSLPVYPYTTTVINPPHITENNIWISQAWSRPTGQFQWTIPSFATWLNIIIIVLFFYFALSWNWGQAQSSFNFSFISFYFRCWSWRGLFRVYFPHFLPHLWNKRHKVQCVFWLFDFLRRNGYWKTKTSGYLIWIFKMQKFKYSFF